MEKRMITTDVTEEDLPLEGSLRPQTLDEYLSLIHIYPSKIEYVLVNGAECEPYITSDYRRMIEEPEKVVKGLQVILTLFDSAKGYICIEDNKPDCIAKMKELVKDIDRIEVKEMMTKYPQGCLLYTSVRHRRKK